MNDALKEHHWDAGRRGESLAQRFLEDKGYRLVAKNYRFGRGEIDLIMEDPAGTLIFVEVKSNRSRIAGHPLERVDGRKILRLQRLAQKYCWENRVEERDMRFDVVGVDLQGDGSVQHVENAFLPNVEGYYRHL